MIRLLFALTVVVLMAAHGAISSVLKLPSTHHVQFSKQRQSE